MFGSVRALRMIEYIKGIKYNIAKERVEQKQQALLERRRRAKEMVDAMKTKFSTETSSSDRTTSQTGSGTGDQTNNQSSAETGGGGGGEGEEGKG